MATGKAIKPGLIERGSGRLLRLLMGCLFVIGVGIGITTGLVHASLPAIVMGVALMVPYLTIRYRDPARATIPFSQVLVQN